METNSKDEFKTANQPSESSALAPTSPLPNNKPVANREEIRLSTRKALQRPKSAGVDTATEARARQIAKQLPKINAYEFAKEPPPRDLLQTPMSWQATAQSTSDISQENQQNSSLIKTIRRVFSRNRPGIAVDHDTQRNPETEERNSGQTARMTGNTTVSGQTSLPISPKDSLDTSYSRNAFAHMQTTERGNIAAPHGASTHPEFLERPSSPAKRLRRSTSNVYRINASRESNRAPWPSPTSAYYTTQPPSPPKSSGSFRKPQPYLRPSPEIYPLPTANDQPQSDVYSTRTTATHSRKDSLDILRERYSQRRVDSKVFEPRAVDETAYHRQKSSSSLDMGIGSARSTYQPDLHLAGTAPRLAMEAAGISARILDLEARLEEVEQSLTKLKSSRFQQEVYRPSARASQEASKDSQQPFPTPPASPSRQQLESADTFLRESTSTLPSRDYVSSPSTPTGPLEKKAEPDDGLHPMTLRDPPLDAARRYESKVLRSSLLDQDSTFALRQIFHVVNAEHNARVALEADLRSLRNAMASLRNEYGGSAQPAPSIPATDVIRSNQTNQPHDVAQTELSEEDNTPFFQIEEQDLPVKFQKMQMELQPMGYDELWSQAAVPMRYQGSNPNYPTSSSQEPSRPTKRGWKENRPLVSKFSFDDTTSTHSR